MLLGVVFYALNSPKSSVRWAMPGTAGEVYSFPPDSLAKLKEPLCGGEERGKEEREGRKGRKWREGKEGKDYPRNKNPGYGFAGH